jgi:hypothetical protein
MVKKMFATSPDDRAPEQDLAMSGDGRRWPAAAFVSVKTSRRARQRL